MPPVGLFVTPAVVVARALGRDAPTASDGGGHGPLAELEDFARLPQLKSARGPYSIVELVDLERLYGGQ